MYHAGIRKYKKRYGGGRRSYGARRKFGSGLSPEVCGSASTLVTGPVGSVSHARSSHNSVGQSFLTWNNPKGPFPDKYNCVFRCAVDSINASAFAVSKQQDVTLASPLAGNDPGAPFIDSTTYPGSVFGPVNATCPWWFTFTPVYCYYKCRSSRIRLSCYNDGQTPFKVAVFPTNIPPTQWTSYLPSTLADFQTWAQKVFYHTVPSVGDGGASTCAFWASYEDVVGESSDVLANGNIGIYPNIATGGATPPQQLWYWCITCWHFDGAPINPSQNDFYMRVTLDHYTESWTPVEPPGSLPTHEAEEDFERMSLEQVRLFS